MAKKKDKKSGMISVNQTVADNPRARFDYHLEDKFEAGIQLYGTEVKSLRLGHASIKEAHVAVKKGEMWLLNSNIPEYQQAGPKMQHPPKRERKLLLHKKEVDKLIGAISREGYTVVPLRLFFNGRGLAKVEIALAKGKKLYDKRETEKKRDWGREKHKLLKQKN